MEIRKVLTTVCDVGLFACIVVGFVSLWRINRQISDSKRSTKDRGEGESILAFENVRLKSENERLEPRNCKLESEIRELGFKNCELKSKNRELKSKNEELGRKNERLRDQIKELENMSLLGELRYVINKRAGENKGQPCWNFNEMIELLAESEPSVETEQNDGTILDNRIEELQSCENCLRGIVRGSRSKEEPGDGDLKIDCGELGALLDNLRNARKNLFRVCIEGCREKWSVLGKLTRGLSDYARKIIEKRGIKVESSSSSGVHELQEEINGLLKWLDENALKAKTYVDRGRSCKAEVEFYEVCDRLLKHFRERESRKES